MMHKFDNAKQPRNLFLFKLGVTVLKNGFIVWLMKMDYHGYYTPGWVWETDCTPGWKKSPAKGRGPLACLRLARRHTPTTLEVRIDKHYFESCTDREIGTRRTDEAYMYNQGLYIEKNFIAPGTIDRVVHKLQRQTRAQTWRRTASLFCLYCGKLSAR